MTPGLVARDSGRALLLSGLVLALSFLLLTTVVTQDRLHGVDLTARALVHGSHGPELLGFMEGASQLGGQPGQVALLVVGLVVLWPRRRRWAVALPLVMAGAGVLQLLAKSAVDRPRPNLAPLGFPSAHVLSLVVLCGYLAYAVSMGRALRRRRGVVLAAAVGAVGTVAYSRMYLDAHWLSDILGGLTAGLAYLLLAIWVVRSAPRLGRVLRRASVPSRTVGSLAAATVGSPADPPPQTLIAAAATAISPVTSASNPA